nr:hypothetical protein [uncultured Noviherbaspirillum sp.]
MKAADSTGQRLFALTNLFKRSNDAFLDIEACVPVSFSRASRILNWQQIYDVRTLFKPCQGKIMNTIIYVVGLVVVVGFVLKLLGLY